MRSIMTLLLVCCCASASAQPWRYTGSIPGRVWMILSPEHPRERYWTMHEAVSAALEGEWRFDITTDGQTLDHERWSWEFFTTAPLQHHIGQIDFALDAKLNLAPYVGGYDLNPLPEDYLRTSRLGFEAEISGHYRSLAFESEFEDVRSQRLTDVQTWFDFASYEEELGVKSQVADGSSLRNYVVTFWDHRDDDVAADYEIEKNLYIRAFQFRLPDVTLSRTLIPVESPATGQGFLEWQRNYGPDTDPFALVDWEWEFLRHATGGGVGGVPEPSTGVLVAIIAAGLGLYCVIPILLGRERSGEDGDDTGADDQSAVCGDDCSRRKVG